MHARWKVISATAMGLSLAWFSPCQARECAGVLADPAVRSYGDQVTKDAEVLVPAINQNSRYVQDYFRKLVSNFGGINGDKSLQARIRAEPYTSFISCFPHLRLALSGLRQAEQDREEAEERTRRENIEHAKEEARIANEREQKLEALRKANDERDAANQRASAAEQRLRDQEIEQAQEEGARLEEEERIKERKRQQSEMAPFNVLVRSYSFYIYVKHCYEKREGYLAVYVNEREMDRARIAIKVISDKIKQADTEINDDAAWKLGNSEANKHEETSEKCHQVLGLLDTAAKAADPDIGHTKKDF